MDHSITLLHLSDFHFNQERRWDADPVLRALTADIAAAVKGGRVPNAVVVTGDLADRGRVEDYAAARAWLDGELLAKALPAGFDRTHVLLVPGNHDVDRSRVKRAAPGLERELLDDISQDTIAQVLDDPEDRAHLRPHRRLAGAPAQGVRHRSWCANVHGESVRPEAD